MKQNFRVLLLVFIFLLIFSSTGTESAHAFMQLDSAQEIINVINQYRIENGLSALQVNND